MGWIIAILLAAWLIVGSFVPILSPWIWITAHQIDQERERNRKAYAEFEPTYNSFKQFLDEASKMLIEEKDVVIDLKPAMYCKGTNYNPEVYRSMAPNPVVNLEHPNLICGRNDFQMNYLHIIGWFRNNSVFDLAYVEILVTVKDEDGIIFEKILTLGHNSFPYQVATLGPFNDGKVHIENQIKPEEILTKQRVLYIDEIVNSKHGPIFDSPVGKTFTFKLLKAIPNMYPSADDLVKIKTHMDKEPTVESVKKKFGLR